MTRGTITLAALVALGACAVAGPAAAQQAQPQLTPLLMDVQDPPVPFRGSDGRTHLVYELTLTNFTPVDVTIRRAQVRTPGGRVLQTLGPKAVAGRLQPAGRRESTARMVASGESFLFVHVTLPAGARAPRALEHRVSFRFAAPLGGRRGGAQTGGEVAVSKRPVVRFGPPLRGAGYISADSCCDASRHTRAQLAVDGRVRLAQRMAVDWEQVDAQGRIYAGPRDDVDSYAIYGDEAIAVADARVAATVTGLPNQTPGQFPESIPLAEADGNAVVLNVRGNYVLYAHLQPGSVRVAPGQRVRRGDVVGLVGNTGNSIVPHLHVQVTSGPSTFASPGVPYEIDGPYTVAGRTAGGTAAFDAAETNGTVLPVRPFTPARQVRNAMPLDQLIVTFP